MALLTLAALLAASAAFWFLVSGISAAAFNRPVARLDSMPMAAVEHATTSRQLLAIAAVAEAAAHACALVGEVVRLPAKVDRCDAARLPGDWRGLFFAS